MTLFIRKDSPSSNHFVELHYFIAVAVARIWDVSWIPCSAVYLVLEGTRTAQVSGKCKWSPPATDFPSYTIWDNQDEPLFLQSLKIALRFGKFHLAMLELCNTYSKKLFILKTNVYTCIVEETATAGKTSDVS